MKPVVGNFYDTWHGLLECVEVFDNYAIFKDRYGESHKAWEPQWDELNLVCLIITETGDIPKYQTANSAGVDLKSAENVMLTPYTPILVHTGIKLAIPVGYEGQVRPRSGLALKQNITVLNSPGTIDADYRGEIGVILINFNAVAQKIEKGDRIAQLVFSKVEQIPFLQTEVLPSTERGEGGFGHTGK